MVVRSPVMRRRESATAVPYSGHAPSAGTWSPNRAVPEVKLVPDTMSGGATCVRATELTDEELETMLYRLHRVRRRRASEAAAAAATASRHSSAVFDTSSIRSSRSHYRWLVGVTNFWLVLLPIVSLCVYTLNLLSMHVFHVSPVTNAGENHCSFCWVQRYTDSVVWPGLSSLLYGVRQEIFWSGSCLLYTSPSPRD